MNINKATREYEQWLTAYTPLVKADIELKHQQMASGVFAFLRATFYRWAQVWPTVCKDQAQAPIVLSVGDLHVENFGTWRDAEGRLVWGVNDFDEAAYLPYANDLVRLAASALFAVEADHLHLEPSEVCAAVLAGYTQCLDAGGRAFVLAEDHSWLRDIAKSELRDPERFWKKIDALPEVQSKTIPESAVVAMEHMLPMAQMPYRIKHRVAGLGSLGRPRYVAVADWEGGRIAREAKALVPSGSAWANAGEGHVEIFYQAIIDRAVRCRDPFVQLQGHWIVRRLAPDCSRIELASLLQTQAAEQLLHAMGWETANIHLGSKQTIKAIKQDLQQQPRGWLHEAANAMVAATQADWTEWKT